LSHPNDTLESDDMGASQSAPSTGSLDAQGQPGYPSINEAFVYQPPRGDADCIRLIRIEPAQQDNDPLACTLVDVTFIEKPRYDALSYRWGDGAAKRHIILNGDGFLVGKNLEDALRYLRSHTQGTLFWIDALCINQGCF